MVVKEYKTTGDYMKQDNYSYEIVKDKERNIIGLLIRYKNNEAIIIPLIDIILQMEKKI